MSNDLWFRRPAATRRGWGCVEGLPSGHDGPANSPLIAVRRVAATILLATALPAFADAGAFFGLSYDFGGSVGLSVKVLSTNRENRGAISAGISYFPRTGRFGVDAGAAYVFTHGAATIGYDFLQQATQLGVGYMNTRPKTEDNSSKSIVTPGTEVPA